MYTSTLYLYNIYKYNVQMYTSTLYKDIQVYAMYKCSDNKTCEIGKKFLLYTDQLSIVQVSVETKRETALEFGTFYLFHNFIQYTCTWYLFEPLL